ncbi:MAG: hypothetical protein ACREFB_20935 [Stellaceae bacterium]
MSNEPLTENPVVSTGPLGTQTGALAHDFNNLLAALLLNLESLEPLVDPGGEAAELVGTCLDAVMQGTELARRLFAVATRLRRARDC